MEPIVATGQGELSALRLDLLRRATEIYLKLAYPLGAVPDVVQRRLVWRECCTPDVLLTGPPFERAGKAGRSGPIYALRLGNHRYPHMKLQIQPWITDAGFMLSVNTHDQVSGIDLSSVDAQAFRELQAENQRLKEAIEQSWDNDGLPTFLRYLRDYIENRAADSGPGGFDGEPEAHPGTTDLSTLA
jgi:hypothetical protein